MENIFRNDEFSDNHFQTRKSLSFGDRTKLADLRIGRDGKYSLPLKIVTVLDDTVVQRLSRYSKICIRGGKANSSAIARADVFTLFSPDPEANNHNFLRQPKQLELSSGQYFDPGKEISAIEV